MLKVRNWAITSIGQKGVITLTTVRKFLTNYRNGEPFSKTLHVVSKLIVFAGGGGGGLVIPK